MKDVNGTKKQADEQLEKKCGECKDPEKMRDLAVSYIRLGDADMAKNNLESAEEFYKKSLEIRLELTSIDAPETMFDLMVCYRRLQKLAIAKKDVQAARKYSRLLAETNRSMKRHEIMKRLSD